MKTFVYGDSFSNHSICKCDRSDMWYAPFVHGELIDRSRPGSSTEEAFLLMHNDAIRDPNARFLLGTGAMYSRLTTYTDGLYENEQIRAHHQIEDCLKYFKTHTIEIGDNTDAFHHTLVWTRYLTQIILTDSLLPTGSWMAVHMHCPREDWQSPEHPMVKHLLDRVNAITNYIDQDHSCNSLCHDWQILPHDWQLYGRHGHHGTEGQRRFRDHIATIAERRKLWG